MAAAATKSEIFACSCEEFFKIISDFDQYPEFLKDVKTCKTLETKGKNKKVEFGISIVKSFKYVINVTEDSPTSVSWTFDKGDLFKKMIGSWKLSNLDGKCKATYSLEAEFGVFVPGMISKALIETNLPNMMKSYRARIEQLYGKK